MDQDSNTCRRQPFLYKTPHYIPGPQKTWSNNTIQKCIQFTFRSPTVYNSLNLFKNKAVQSLFGDSHSILTVIPSKIKLKKSENMPPIYNDKDVQYSSKGKKKVNRGEILVQKTRLKII